MNNQLHRTLTKVLYFCMILYALWMFLASYHITQMQRQIEALQQKTGDTHEARPAERNGPK